ncbi:MAG: deoxyribonuclease IV [Chloroflexi bacterium]|nr:deoxyribonuclease IV [Chloroflexota bacterium]
MAPLLGAHVPAAGGMFNAYTWANDWDCTAMQVFTKSPNQWAARTLSDDEVSRFIAAGKESGVKVVTAHDSYLINLASPDDAIRAKSRNAFRDELERCERLEIPYLVTHMGSHMGQGDDTGLAVLAASIDAIHADLRGYKVQILLEATAGQGTNLGYKLEHLSTVLHTVRENERLGVCLDTCHLFAAGYDIRDVAAYRKTMSTFKELIGFERLKCFHLNDAKFELASRKDRHERIGLGKIGREAFRLIMRDRRLSKVPKIIETPELTEKGGDDLRLLRKLADTPT